MNVTWAEMLELARKAAEVARDSGDELDAESLEEWARYIAEQVANADD